MGFRIPCRIPAQKVHLFVASPFEKKNYEAPNWGLGLRGFRVSGFGFRVEG